MQKKLGVNILVPTGKNIGKSKSAKMLCTVLFNIGSNVCELPKVHI